MSQELVTLRSGLHYSNKYPNLVLPRRQGVDSSYWFEDIDTLMAWNENLPQVTKMMEQAYASSFNNALKLATTNRYRYNIHNLATLIGVFQNPKVTATLNKINQVADVYRTSHLIQMVNTQIPWSNLFLEQVINQLRGDEEKASWLRSNRGKEITISNTGYAHLGYYRNWSDNNFHLTQKLDKPVWVKAFLQNDYAPDHLKAMVALNKMGESSHG